MRDCGNPASGNNGLFLAIVQTEEVKQGVEHFTHPSGGILNILYIHSGFIHVTFFFHQSGISGYSRQRCTQFVGDGMHGFLAGIYQCLVFLYSLL